MPTRENAATRIEERRELEDALSSEHLAERVEQTLQALLEVERLHVARDTVKVKVAGNWVGLDDLASGFRKALRLVTALEAAQLAKEWTGRDAVVVIEEFEGKLHYDLAVVLIDYMTRLDVTVILETHAMLHARAALTRGWAVYYVKNGETHQLASREDLRRTELFETEYRAYELAEQA